MLTEAKGQGQNFSYLQDKTEIYGYLGYLRKKVCHMFSV